MESIVDRLTCYQLTIIFGNFASTNSRAPSVFVSCTGCLLSIFSGLLVNDLLTIIIRFVDWSNGDVFTNVQSIDVGFHAFQLLQLCDVDGIGVVCTGGYAVDLAGYLTIGGTNGYGCLGGLPSSSTVCRILAGSRIIAFYRITCYSCNRITANSYTISNLCFGLLSKGNGLSNFVSINLSISADSNILSGHCTGFRADGNTVISCRGIHTNGNGIAATSRSRKANSNRIVSASVAGCIGFMTNDDGIGSSG